MRRLGGQEPTFQRVGTYAYTRGPEAVEMFEAYGRNYYDSQKYEMELFFARNDDDSFAAMSIGINKPRQNGKSFALRDYCIWMAAVEGKSVLYTAHHGRTVRKMFKEMCDFIEAHDDFKEELDYIYRAGGYEGIYFKNGACVEYQTRTDAGGRGGTYRIICLDEAQELTAAQQDAVLPTASAAGEIDEGEADPQMIYIGTTPGPDSHGTVFRELHDRAHEGDTTIWWLEWAAVGNSLEQVDVGSVDLWYACNPAMGRRMSERVVQNEHDTMSRDGFARERLGWWSPTAGKARTVIDEKAWDAMAVSGSPDSKDRAFAVKFSPDGAESVLAVAVKDGDKVHVEVVERMTMAVGTGWLADFATERKSTARCFVVDGKAGAGNLVEKLGKMPAGYIVTPSAAQVVSACTAMVDAVAEKRVSWYEEQNDLRDSAVTSVRRPIGTGGGWGFGGENPVPIEACSLALWGVLNSKRDPERKMRIG